MKKRQSSIGRKSFQTEQLNTAHGQVNRSIQKLGLNNKHYNHTKAGFLVSSTFLQCGEGNLDLVTPKQFASFHT